MDFIVLQFFVFFVCFFCSCLCGFFIGHVFTRVVQLSCLHDFLSCTCLFVYLFCFLGVSRDPSPLYWVSDDSPL